LKQREQFIHGYASRNVLDSPDDPLDHDSLVVEKFVKHVARDRNASRHKERKWMAASNAGVQEPPAVFLALLTSLHAERRHDRSLHSFTMSNVLIHSQKRVFHSSHQNQLQITMS
jgi:hypothetical protein